MTKHKISYRIITIILIISVLFQLLISISFATDDISDIEPEVSTDVEKTYSVETAEGSSLPTETESETKPKEEPISEAEIEADNANSRQVIATTYKGYTVSISYKQDGLSFSENASIQISEISDTDDEYDSYIKESASAANIDPDKIELARALDISIIDSVTGDEIQPEAELLVQIQLEDTQLEQSVSVVHFVKEEQEVEQPVLVESNVTDNTIEFNTDGFSIYVIIDGPPPIDTIYTTAQALTELPNNGFFMSITRGSNRYFFKNTINRKNCIDRTGNNEINLAAAWYFEPTENENEYFLYTLINNEKIYMKVRNDNFMELSPTDKTPFTVSLFTNNVPGIFYIKKSGTTSTGLNYSGSNDSFKCYTTKNDDCKIELTYVPVLNDDDYDLDNKQYGIIYYDGTSIYANGMTTEQSDYNGFKAAKIPVQTNPVDFESSLLVPSNTDVVQWTLHSVGSDKYKLSVFVEGQVKYLTVNDSAIELDDIGTDFQYCPGTGGHAGKFKLCYGNMALSYHNKNGFVMVQNGTSSREWLNFAEETELQPDDFVVYTAKKVSVSDESVSNGSKILLYTRVWDSADKQYKFYAVAHNGMLVPCYESGDSIQWIGTQLNTLMWNFTEYYYEGTNIPNYYYELKNLYTNQFICPQIANMSGLSNDVIGLNLTGRRDGKYYSPILAWDNTYYTYAGLKIDGNHIASGHMSEAADFYFAIIQPTESYDPLETVATIDNNEHGISMKMVNFGNKPEDILSITGTVYDNNGNPHNSSTTTSREQRDVLGESVYDQYRPTQGLLSTNLNAHGYPVSTVTERSLEDLFAAAEPVNHLFDESIYNGSGYYEFNSTKNFATLDENNDFKVYTGLGTPDFSNKNSLKHGQFLPYNDISPEYISSLNPENLYDAMLVELPNNDPRKHEPLYLVRQPDYYFGMELEASFVQTPNGLDAWGHDIVYEFTGDDDFWLYVDGELVIDLGGIHSAYPGSVNFCTGEVRINGTLLYLKDIFAKNYAVRNNLEVTDQQVLDYINDIFVLSNDGHYIFKTYSSHTMKIFFMERGASASNLHMRFNLTSVKEGQIYLSKQLSGAKSDDFYLTEYGFQIYYALTPPEGEEMEFQRLTNNGNDEFVVKRVNSSVPVKYLQSYTPSGSTNTYQDVFFLNPNETVVINIPDDTIQYYIVEVGVKNEIYDEVLINDVPTAGTETSDISRSDYYTSKSTIQERPHVVYDNHISESAIRTLTITKKTYDFTGENEINDPDSLFNFRLYLAGEDNTFVPANMKSYTLKDQSGHYCRWNAELQHFESTDYTSLSGLSEDVLNELVFYTSPNGAISNIPAYYHVEVGDLLIDTRFKVEERNSEIPDGYRFLRYVRDAGSYLIEDENEVNIGIVRAGQSPAIEVHNKQVFDLTVQKVWSDQPYMNHYDNIYFGIYYNGILVNGTVKELQYPSTILKYEMDSLPTSAAFSDYEVRELSLSGTYYVDENGYVQGEYTATAIEPNSALNISAQSKTDTEECQYNYTVSYSQGSASGLSDNIRTDTVTNSRNGIRIIKQDDNGMPLKNAVFTLKDHLEQVVGAASYISDENGLVTHAYLSTGEIYHLTEISAPSGYQGLTDDISFQLETDGTITVLEAQEGIFEIDNENEPTLIIKNKPITLTVMKVNAETNEPLQNVRFALYRQISINGVSRIDYQPMSGYENMITDESGRIQEIDASLPPNTYYLVEKETPNGYCPLKQSVVFTVSSLGTIDIIDNEEAKINFTNGNYVITVKNTPNIPILTGNFEIQQADAYRFFFMLLMIGIGASIYIWYIKRKKTNDKEQNVLHNN